MSDNGKRSRRAKGEGSVFFHTLSNEWRARVTTPDGRRITRTASTEDGALVLLRGMRAAFCGQRGASS